jgi:hypothetical protein
MFNAIDDFGIREENESTGQAPHLFPEHELVEKVKDQLYDEALHGALRIAGLVSIYLLLSSTSMNLIFP